MSEDNNSTMNNNNNNEQGSVFSEQEKDLASKAKQEYDAGQYDGELWKYVDEVFDVRVVVCLKSLQKLLESHPDDPKVLFNLALTEYALSSFQRTDLFKSQLNKIAEKVRSFIPSPIFKSFLRFFLASLCIR